MQAQVQVPCRPMTMMAMMTTLGQAATAPTAGLRAKVPQLRLASQPPPLPPRLLRPLLMLLQSPLAHLLLRHLRCRVRRLDPEPLVVALCARQTLPVPAHQLFVATKMRRMTLVTMMAMAMAMLLQATSARSARARDR